VGVFAVEIQARCVALSCRRTYSGYVLIPAHDVSTVFRISSVGCTTNESMGFVIAVSRFRSFILFTASRENC
jgi:hypothetical protein